MNANVPTRTKSARALHAHLTAFDANYPHMFVYVQELPHLIDTLQDQIRASPSRYQHLWEELLQQGIAAGELRAELDVTATVCMIMGMCNWLLHRWYRQGGRLDTDTLAWEYTSALLDGITTRPTSEDPHPR